MQLSHCYEITVGRFIRFFYVFEVANTVVKRVCSRIAGYICGHVGNILFNQKESLFSIGTDYQKSFDVRLSCFILCFWTIEASGFLVREAR